MTHKHYIWTYLAIGLPLGVILVVLVGWYRDRPIFMAPAKPPQIVTANIMDADRIYAVSKFRSAAGHDYSNNAWDGETCRSMKNYFNVSQSSDAQGGAVRSEPETGHPNISVYAPFDGRVSQVQPSHIGTQVSVRSAREPAYAATLDHIDLLPGLGLKSAVKSGQRIGTVGPKDVVDFALEGEMVSGQKYYVSIFEAMTNQAFAPYAALGFIRSDFAISKQYRDTHPLRCGAPGGSGNEGFYHEPGYNWADDFTWLRPNPYGALYGPNGMATIHIGPPAR